MTTYGFGAFVVLDESGHPAAGAIVQAYAPADTGFTLPLDLLDSGGVPIPNVTASDLGVGGSFRVDGYPLVVLKSGSLPAFEHVSGGGILDRMDEVEATANQAVEDVAAYIAENPSDLPTTGRAASRVLTVGSDGSTPAWSDPTLLTSVAWDNVSTKPTTFPADLHTHLASQVSDASPVGRQVITATDAAAARAAIGAGTGNGTSNLTLGTTATTAAPGNKVYAATTVTFTPSGSITATDVQSAIVQAGAMGGGGSGRVDYRYYASGAYPVRGTLAAGTMVFWIGPTWPTIGGLYMVSGLDIYLATAV